MGKKIVRREVLVDLLRLWESAEITMSPSAVNSTVRKLLAGRDRYEKVSASVGVPWWMIGLIHGMEGGFRWSTHLHNGDRLKHRTVRVPRGRPAHGSPPFTWEESAMDALRMKKFDEINSWPIVEVLYQLERYNGWGYRQYHPSVPSPYLWSGCNHYRRGKYIADGKWSSTAVSKQVGAATIMLALKERGIQLEDSVPIAQDDRYVLVYDLDSGSLCVVACEIKDFTRLEPKWKMSLGSTLAQIAAATSNFRSRIGEVPVEMVRPANLSDVEEYGAPVRPTESDSPIRSYAKGSNVMLSDHFHLREFDCKCRRCTETIISEDTIKGLEAIRAKIGKPIRVTSGYRCPAHNAEVGGVKASRHLMDAADIKITGVKPSTVAKVAEEVGFKGIGTYATFTHVDMRPNDSRWKG